MEENKNETNALVENETTDLQEVNETSEETSTDDDNGFDANAFAQMEASTEDDSEDDNYEENTNEDTFSEDNNDDETDEPVLEWQSEETEETESTEENNNELENNSTGDLDYSVLSDKIGVEIKSEEDFINYMKEKDAKIQELQELTKGNATNDKIKSWQKYIQLNDKELMEANLKAEGFSEAEITEAIDAYLDNGTLKIEAKKIRNTLNRHIDNERNSMIEQQKANAKREQQEVAELRNNIKKVIDESETMFGYKMAKDADQLKKVRESHYKYTTEQFYKDITKDEKSMVEAAWLWKNKDVILKAAKNNGLQKGKQKVLDSITKPDTDTTSRIREESTKEFNVGKFVS